MGTKRRIEATAMEFLLPLLDVSLRDNVKDTEIKKQLGTELTAEVI